MGTFPVVDLDNNAIIYSPPVYYNSPSDFEHKFNRRPRRFSALSRRPNLYFFYYLNTRRVGLIPANDFALRSRTEFRIVYQKKLENIRVSEPYFLREQFNKRRIDLHLFRDRKTGNCF